MPASLLPNLFQQILEGWDIPTPAAAVRVKQNDAELHIEYLPYSILTNLAHAVLWQDLWLAKLSGKKGSPSMESWRNDWRVPDPSEWPVLRKRFVEGLEQAQRIANAHPFVHQCTDDQQAVETLVKIAIHASYHLGQMNLLKRSLKLVNKST